MGPGYDRPRTLIDFIRDAGGIQDPRGDLKAMGMDSVQRFIAKPGAGLGPDAMRQAAAQAGYLGADISHATANTNVNDLFDAIASGQPTHSVFDQEGVDAWQRFDDQKAAREMPTEGVSRPVNGPLRAPGLPEQFPPVADAVGSARSPGRQITAEGIDYVKRSLDDKIGTAQRAGANDDVRVYTGLKHSLVSAVDNHPDPNVAGAWQAARRAYAGPSAEIEALGKGYDALGNNVTREQVAREYGGLNTDGEREHYRKGLFDGMRERLGQKSDTANFVNVVAGNPVIRDKLASVAPSPAHLDAFNATIARAQQRFTEAQRPTVEGWHGALSSLDAQAAKGDPGVLSARDALAAELGKLPPYARARQFDQDYSGLSTALDQGKTALRSGPNALHPNDFADRFGTRTPAGQESERTGMRGDMARALGTSKNDLRAVETLLQGPDGWNAAKIGTAFGQPAADALGGTVNREKAFKETFNSISRNSETARNKAAAKGFEDADVKPWEPFPHHVGAAHLTGLAMDYGIRQPANMLARMLQGPIDNTGRDLDIGRALTQQGPAARKLLVDALVAQKARASNMALENTTRDHVALISAMMASGAANARHDDRRNARR